MTRSPAYTLVGAWLLIFAFRVILGATDQLSLWALRLLTIAILGAICIGAVKFVAQRIRSLKTGEPVLTESALRTLLLAAAAVGLVIRVIAWDPGSEGVAAWAGGLLVVVSIAGLLVLQFRRERAAIGSHPSFYFSPYWKYGLLVLCIASLAVQGAVRPEGAVSTGNVGIFWLSLIALIVQSIGRWARRRRDRRSCAPTG